MQQKKSTKTKKNSSTLTAKSPIRAFCACIKRGEFRILDIREVEVVVVVVDLDEVARPSLFTERIGLFAGKSHNQVILHHVVHGISLHNDISITRDNIPIKMLDT